MTPSCPCLSFTTLGEGCYYYTHSTEEALKPRAVRFLAQSHTAAEGQGQDSSPGLFAAAVPDLGFPPVSCPGSAPINSVLLFILGVVCAFPLLRTTGPVAAPREVFRGRSLLSVEPGSKVRCGSVPGGCGLGTGSSRGSGDRTLHLWPLPGTEQPLPSQPFTRQEIIGFAIGSVSSALYLLSRLPQIRTNVSPGQGRGRRGRVCGLCAAGLGSNCRSA